MAKRRKRKPKAKKNGLPKGSYRVPGGGIARTGASTFIQGDRRLFVKGIRHEEPDLRRLAEALVALARSMSDEDWAEFEADRSQADQDDPKAA